MRFLAKDIVPSLMTKIRNEFNQDMKSNSLIQELIKSINSGTATHVQSQQYAAEVGRILANVFKRTITSDTLPDGRMYYNIADRILGETLTKNHELISTAAEAVQSSLNKQANIGIKAVKPKLNKDRIKGLVDKVSNADNFNNVAWVLDEPVVNFSQSVVDETIKANLDFQGKSGLPASVTRIPESGACEWCREVAGTYEYPNVPDDVWRRHERCRCVIDYTPRTGKTERLSGTGKAWW